MTWKRFSSILELKLDGLVLTQPSQLSYFLAIFSCGWLSFLGISPTHLKPQQYGPTIRKKDQNNFVFVFSSYS
jgi:hypothetical protein